MNIVLQMPGERAGAWLEAIRAALPDARVALWPDAPPSQDYALVWRPPAGLFERIRPARAIFNLGAGVDALMRIPTLPGDVPVVRLEDAGMAAQMAEYVTLAVLCAYREMDAYAAQQKDGRWRPRPRIDKNEFGIGFLGFGLLGQAVARAVAPFGFPLHAWSRRRKELPGIRSYAGADDLRAFLARSHVLVCLLPVTPTTEALLDRATLGALPAGAHVVNVARGGIIVDADLVALLDEGHLASATLDVFRDEPLPGGHAFWHHPRIRLTPHVSAVTLIEDSVAQVAAKIRQLERGEAVTGVVDRAHGY